LRLWNDRIANYDPLRNARIKVQKTAGPEILISLASMVDFSDEQETLVPKAYKQERSLIFFLRGHSNILRIVKFSKTVSTDGDIKFFI